MHMQTVSHLVESFVPDNYNLSLVFDRVGRNYTGTVTIKGVVTEAATDVRVHAKDLAIASVTMDGKAATFSLENDDEVAITHPDIAPGPHTFVISFSAAITDGMHGIYPCYFEHDGVKKELIATQFESHYAREAFPCIDEPAAKATFDVTLTTETDITVLGNMPVKQQREENNQLVTTFDTTPRMSSYLLAWVFGELHKKSATTKSGVEVNVWATPAQPASSLDFGLDIAVRSIDFFDDYFDTPFPLPKSDQVALPDFSSGAMENWGLVTYRETALLAEPENTSIVSKHHIATVIAHELSHQWFGNLVTMKWWNDLWLNESFANMMEYVAIDALEPDWQIWLDHASSETIQALRRDSIEGIQSIRSEVNHPDEISTLFDPSIVYAKGGRLLRMLQTYIGDEALQKGLQDYFKRFAYQNTEADDLWYCLSQASGQDIGKFMNAWIVQSGFPVVHVTQEGAQVTLRQEQFFIGPHGSSDQLWPIPLNSSSDALPKLLDTQFITVTYEATTPLHLNTGGTAHFMTHYSPKLLQQLLDHVDKLSDIDRLQLLHEQTLLAQAGIISSAELIGLLDYYKDESTEAVWDIIAVTINELKKFVEQDSPEEQKLRQLTARIADPQYQRLGWASVQNESETDTKLRSVIISLMLYGERPDVINEALKRFPAEPIEQLDPELRISLMGAAVRYSPEPEKVVDDLLKLHQTTSNSELQEDIAAALTTTNKEVIYTRLMTLLKDTSVIRPQDFIRWFIWLLRNRYARADMWQWTRDNWPWIVQQFHGDSHFDSFPRYIASSLLTAQQLDEYRTFFEPFKKQLVLRRNIELGISELQGRVELIERDGPAVREALLKLN